MGSATWWRGLGTCAGLIALTYVLSPTMRPLPSASGVAMTADAIEQARALAIAPLAFGSGTGRRMNATDAVQPLTDTPERPVIDIAATIGEGGGLAGALQRAGVAGSEAARIAELTAQEVEPSSIAPGTALALTLGRRANKTQARPVESLAFRARFDMRVNFARAGGQLVMQRMPIAVDSTPMRIEGDAASGIFTSATAAGAPGKAVETFIRALAAKIPINSLDTDARYDMIVERDRAATGETRFGKLLYIGLTQGARRTRMIEWTVGGRTDWYDANGVGRQRSGFTMPVVNARKTSSFGMRLHPLFGYSRMHRGTDYGAHSGTPIRAVTDGHVSFAGRHGGHGNMVKLAHAGGLGSGYAHMSRIAVAPGMRVTQGQVIGFVGSTGFSTGPHLHFEVYKGGRPVSPASVNFASAPLLSGSELAAFRAKFARITGGSAETRVQVAMR